VNHTDGHQTMLLFLRYPNSIEPPPSKIIVKRPTVSINVLIAIKINSWKAAIASQESKI